MDKRIVVKVVAIVRAASLLVGQDTSRVALKDGGFEIIREYHLPILSTPRIPPSVPSLLLPHYPTQSLTWRGAYRRLRDFL